MSESDLRGKMTSKLKCLDATAVENPACPGTPDVNYIEGWIELKWLREWPARDDTGIKIPHYTREQRNWALKRSLKKGNCWLLLQVRLDYLLFTAEAAALYLYPGTTPREPLIDLATKHWGKGMKWKELIEFLKSHN